MESVAEDRLIESYEDPFGHETASRIIRRYSTNPVDVREYVLLGRDLSHIRRVLDLGCGFGFMAERLAPLVHPAAVIWGIDLCQSNRDEFLRRVRRHGRTTRFVAMRLGDHLPWPAHSFDLVLASYSLYFFPRLIPDIARVLDREGVFLAITHTLESQRDLLDKLGVRVDMSPLVGLVALFCAENGYDMLAPWFGKVERVDYTNTIRFTLADIDDLIRYLRFKVLLPGSEFLDDRSDLSGPLAEEKGPLSPGRLLELLRSRGPLEIRKDDAAFWCWDPRPGESEPMLAEEHSSMRPTE